MEAYQISSKQIENLQQQKNVRIKFLLPHIAVTLNEVKVIHTGIKL